MRDVADAAGVTERTALAIVADLEAAGYITRERVGRRNRYTINADATFRHTAQDGLTVGPLLALLATPRRVGAFNDSRGSGDVTLPEM